LAVSAEPQHIAQVVRDYERWLGRRLSLIPRDLVHRHERMRRDALAFLRGSFFRWADLWPVHCPELTAAPRVLAIGDLHVENFGTWRDRDGRLAWGVNDFDEAALIAYTNDLVRLCTSALLATAKSGFRISPRVACETILSGYTESLEKGGEPIVLAERHTWLRDLAAAEVRNQREYWDAMTSLRTVPRVDPGALRILKRAMPEPGIAFRVVHRMGGAGSLGRQRFTALADWRGGLIAREAKALTGSAWHWRERARPDRIRYEEIVARAVRIHDPFVHAEHGWVVRRLAPDCRRIELADLPSGDARRLLRRMGWETANVHLGTRAQRTPILRDLGRRKGQWLRDAACRMADATVRDWQHFRTG
jgi:hypothetical protein